jgi:hypothetical protein
VFIVSGTNVLVRAARLLPVLALWAAAATALTIPARRVADWYVMTDELLYERLAFSVARTGSPLPALHGQHVPVANQLYPILLASVAGHQLVPSFLVRAHTLNAIVMTSAAVPAFLLARDVLRSSVGPYVAAALAVAVPWLMLASFLLTEVAAYPAFLWAVYLVQRAIARPSVQADALALVGLAAALLARTQLAVLVVVAALAVVVIERQRAGERHRLLAAAGALVLVVLVALAVAGHASSLLGTYSGTAHGSLVTWSLPRAFAQHAATLALGLGLLPALLGSAWLGARAWRLEPGPTVAILAVVLLLLEVASFDLRYGDGLPRDRYLFYAAPLLLIGFVGALEDAVAPRRALIVPAIVLASGIAWAPLPTFAKVSVDVPTAVLDDYIVRNGGRWLLALAGIVLLVFFALARVSLPRRVVAIVLAAATLAALVAETAYAFDRVLRTDGTSDRPITASPGAVLDWIDRTVGPGADVTMIPYAQIAADYWDTAFYWWDLEFWNRSVTRASYPGNRFAEIQSTFPNLDLRFDRRTGRANTSPTRYVAQSDFETRFRVRGPTVSLTRDVRLIDAGSRWYADWRTSGLDDDGFTVAGRPVRLLVYPAPGQRGRRLRHVTFQVLALGEEALGSTRMTANSEHAVRVQVCVPPDRPGSIVLRPSGSASVYGDFGTRAGIAQTRVRSVRIQRIALADELGTC